MKYVFGFIIGMLLVVLALPSIFATDVVVQSGNVGIGANTPQHLLAVSGTGKIANFSDTGNNRNIAFSPSDGTIDLYGANFNLNRYSSNNVVLTSGGGKVGIGTTNLGTKLEVNGTTTIGLLTTNTVSERTFFINYTNIFSSTMTADKTGADIFLNITGTGNSAFNGNAFGIKSTIIENSNGEFGNGKLYAGYFNATSPTLEGTIYGIYAFSRGGDTNSVSYAAFFNTTGVNDQYGIYATASGGDNNYGVYANAFGGVPNNFAGYFQIASDTAGSVLVLKDNDGTCTYNPESGSVTVSCTSDRSLKENERPVNVTQLWNKTLGFSVKSYEVISSGDTNIGVIAQDVQTTNPEMVKTFTYPNNQTSLMVEEPNPWELVKLIQLLKEENDVMKGELCSNDPTYAFC